MPQIEDLREQFPVCRSHIYLNHAAVCPLPIACTEAMGGYLHELSHHGIARGPSIWTEALNTVRDRGARLLHAEDEDIFIVRSTTQGLSIVALGFPFQPGDNLVLAEHEFPANQRVWMPLRKRGVEIRFVRSQQGRIALDDLAAAIDDKTRVVSLSFVQFHTGFRIDLAAVAELCRPHDALLCVDAIQGLGAFDLDVKAAGVDFLSADAHKWLLGPEGVGLGYCSPRALERIEPALEGWLSVAHPFDFYDLAQPLKNTAQRFEDSAYNVAGIIGLGGSLSLFHKFGLPAISARILELTDHLAEGLERRGWKPLSPRARTEEKSGILTASPPADPKACYKRLEEAGVVLSLRDFPDGRQALRFAPHAYNTVEEMEQVLAVL